MNHNDIQDILGIGHTKLGFFHIWQQNLQQLKDAHAESERQRLSNLAILDSITDLMMVLDKDMRILSVNKIFEQLFPGDHLGKHCYELFTHRDTPCPECPAFRCLVHKSVEKESSIFSIQGKNLHFDMVASPLPHPSGKGQAVLMLKRDVTGEKRLQAQIYQSEKMASIGILAAGVAHEINNPLTAIAGFAEGISRRIPKLTEALPPDVKDDLAEYSATILRESARCRDIVQALMNFSRPLPSRSAVNITAMIEDALALLRHAIRRSKNVLFCLDLASDIPDVWVDDTQMRQVVLNLVVNALDALEPMDDSMQKRITIRTLRRTNQLLLEVEDTGCGIAPEHLQTAFEPFFTTKPKGLGLGLSVCYSVIKAHGGDIFLHSIPERKTTATVCLPLLPEAGHEPAAG